MEKNKVSEVVDVEPVFACNICDVGFDSETEIKEHINEKIIASWVKI